MYNSCFIDSQGTYNLQGKSKIYTTDYKVNTVVGSHRTQRLGEVGRSLK